MASSNPLGDQAVRVVTLRNGLAVSGTVATVQELSRQATGGTFKLLFEGEVTSSLDFDASTTEINDALEALAAITGVTVTGAGIESDPGIIIFDTLVPAVRPAGKLGVDERLLTGPSPTAMVRVTTLGETAGVSIPPGYRVAAIEQPASTEGTNWQFNGDMTGNGTFVLIHADDGAPVLLTKSTSNAQITRIGADVGNFLSGYHSIQLIAQSQMVTTPQTMTLLLERI